MLQAIGKRIVLKPIDRKSDDKILLPNMKPSTFEVICIGSDVKNVNVQDVVYLDKYAGAEIDHENIKYLIVEESNVLAVVR